MRHGFYASTVPRLIGNAAETGIIAAPKDGKISWTTHADLAEVDAHIAVNEGSFEGPTAPLTGSEALDLTDIAALLSSNIRREVIRKVLSDAEQQAKLVALGLPAGAVAISMGLYQAARAGEFATSDPALANIIGKRPITLRTYLEAELNAPPNSNTNEQADPSSSRPQSHS